MHENGKSFILSFFAERIIDLVGMKSNPKIVDLSRKVGTVETLTEARINCDLEEKVFALTIHKISFRIIAIY